MESIKENIIKFIAITFFYLALMIGFWGGLVYYIYRGIDLACVAIYECWHGKSYLPALGILAVSSLVTTGIWLEINELALKISWWIFNSLEYHYGLFIIFLFCFATIVVSKAIKANDNEKQAGEESHRD